MTTHVRRYEIGGLIAQGGMAEICAACAVSEPGVSKRVALKRIRNDFAFDPAFVARFFDEARLAMQLGHANVVQVFDFGRTEADEFFLAMEFVEGVDLQRLRRAAGCERLPPAEALHVVAQVLRGLDYAHRRADSAGLPLNIVHLDVKPANVLLSFEGEVKLTDFGVARSRDASRPTAGISGTIPFMSPEQARGERLDARSDVFSAGVVLFALLTGTAPFGEEEEDGGGTLARVRAGQPAPGLAALAPPLAEILSRALDPDPGRRFESAGAFADALEELAFSQGLRGGGTLLRERLLRTFPGERDRLNALFMPQSRAEGLAVARPGSDLGETLLSRIPDVEEPRRQTLIAVPAPRPLSRPAVAAAVLVVALGAFGAATYYRAFASAAPGPDASVAPAAAAPDVGLGNPAHPTPGPDAATGPDAAAPEEAPAPRSERPNVALVPMGTLSVNASPWGTVSVNGKPAGTTPLLAFPVRAGPVTVAVENPKLGRRVLSVRVHPHQDTALIVDLREPARTK